MLNPWDYSPQFLLMEGLNAHRFRDLIRVPQVKARSCARALSEIALAFLFENCQAASLDVASLSIFACPF